MGFFDFLKSKKKKAEAEAEKAEVLGLEVDPADIDPPETRYTEEYREFLETQEAGERSGELPEEENAPCAEGASPEGEEAGKRTPEMKRPVFWAAVSAFVMIALPWLFRSLILGYTYFTAIFSLVYVLNPIFSAVVGVFAGRDMKALWYLLLFPPLFFLAGIGLLFTLSSVWVFFRYAVLYLALGTAAMLISAAIRKHGRQMDP